MSNGITLHQQAILLSLLASLVDPDLYDHGIEIPNYNKLVVEAGLVDLVTDINVIYDIAKLEEFLYELKSKEN